jgi:hypothetical protein
MPERSRGNTAIPEPLHDRSPERFVVAFERVPVPLSPVDREALVACSNSVYPAMRLLNRAGQSVRRCV